MTETVGIVGRYELVREIGHGGMATVFLARQIDLDRFVALKRLEKGHTPDDSLLQRFLRESRLAGSLAHPNIVTVFDFVESDGSQYIAMELMPRGSLRQHLGGALTSVQAAGVLADTLAGLMHAERKGIVHRDLKPENLMVTGEGGVKIADFGIAKAAAMVHTGDFRTGTGLTMGTPGYMAPEQAMALDVGPWTDLYSLGCVAYELFVGRLPFSDTAVPMALLLRHINEPIPSAVVARPGIDPDISAWIDRLLVKDPSRRTRSAEVALDELDELMIAAAGPRWRRTSALPEFTEAGALGAPWTPPPGPAASYETFRPASGAPEPSIDEGDAEPVPEPAPPSEQTPVSEPPSVPSAMVATDARPVPEAASASVEALPAPASDDEAVEAATPATLAPAATPPRRAAPVRRRRLLAGAAAVGLAAAAAVAVLMSGGDGEDPAPTGNAVRVAPGAVLKAGPFRASTPPGWKRVSRPATIPGLALDPAGAAAPGGDAEQGTLLVGVAPRTAHTPSLLPDGFLDALNRRGDDGPGHKLGKFEAYRYSALQSSELGRTFDLYVVPTDAGVAALACIPPTVPESAFADGCAAAVRSFTAEGARAYPLGPEPAYADAVSAAFRRLATDSRTAHERLARATADEPRYRAAADDLASAFKRAADTLDDASAGPAVERLHAAVERATGSAAGRYGALAESARRSRPARARAGARRAAAGERSVEVAVARLLRAGYEDAISSRFRARAVPSLKARPKPRRDSGQPAPTAGSTAPQPTPTAANPSASQGSRPQPTATQAPPKPTATATAQPPVTTEG